MSSDPSTAALVASRIRAVARVWTFLVWLLGLILLIGTRKGLSSSTLENIPQDILIPVFLFISLVGLGIAWRWEGWGALVNIGFYLAVLPLYWLLHQEWLHLSIMVGLSPLILPGVLFLIAWLLSKRAG